MSQPDPSTHQLHLQQAQILTLHVDDKTQAARMSVVAQRGAWIDEFGEWVDDLHSITADITLRWSVSGAGVESDLAILRGWHQDNTTGLVVERLANGTYRLSDPDSGAKIVLPFRNSTPLGAKHGRVAARIVLAQVVAAGALLLASPLLGAPAQQLAEVAAVVVASFGVVAWLTLAALLDDLRCSEEWRELTAEVGTRRGLVRLFRAATR